MLKEESTMSDMSENDFIDAVLSLGFVTREQIEQCRELQLHVQKTGREISFHEILVRKQYLTSAQIQAVLRHARNVGSDNVLPKTSIVEKGARDLFPKPTPDIGDFDPWKEEISRNKFGRYEIREKLGQGGMGAVYKAYDPELGREIALKVALKNEEKTLKRFDREARVMAKLNHPNIIKILDIGTEGGRSFFAMEFVQGSDLDHIFQKRIALSRFLRILVKVSHAVHYAHGEGVVHRDLKPANIMVDKDEQPKVLDFGLAKDMEREEKLSQSQDIVGTPEYMPPEQAEGKVRGMDSRSDVYSLGAILYRMLAGRPPFVAANAMNLLYQIAFTEPLPPSRFCSTVPREIEAISLKALEKGKERRYQSVLEFAEDISRYLEGKPVSAKPVTPLGQAWKWVRRNRAVSLVTLAAILVILSILGWGYADRQNEVRRLIREKDTILARATDAGKIEKKYSLSEIPGMPVPPEAEAEIEAALKVYIKASRLMEQAGKLAPLDHRVQTALYEIQKEIGFLALLGRNFLMSQAFFERCKELRDTKEAEKLLQNAEDKRKELIKSQLARVEKIMSELEAGPPEEGMIDEYVTELVRMRGGHTVKKLLEYLESTNGWQRHVSVEVLGKLGDRFTKKGDKDVVEWLMARLEKLSIPQDTEEMEKIVWALGRLRDCRANRLVARIRFTFGGNTLFWQRTRLPYRWIPIEDDGGEPDGTDASFDRAIDKHNKGDLDGAIEDYNRVLRLDPSFTEAYLERGRARQDKGDLDGAIEDYNRVVRFAPGSVLAYMNRGSARQDKGDLDGAIEDYNQAIRLNPRFADVYNNRGIARKARGDLDGAIEDYDQAISLKPYNADIYINRGIALRSRGDMEKAVEDFDKATQLNPRSVEAYMNRGITLQGKGDLDGAVVAYNKAVQLNPRSAEAYMNRGIVRQAQGDVAGAIEDYNLAIQCNPRSADPYINRGSARHAQQDLENAIEDYNLAIQYNPRSELAYINRGTARQAKGDIDGAIEDYTMAIQCNPGSGDAYYNRGNSRQAKGDIDGAIEDYNLAIQRKPSLASAYKNRALMFMQKGLHQQAASDLRMYLKIYPNHPDAQKMREYIRQHEK